MLNVKKIMILNMVAFATLVCIAQWNTKISKKISEANCIETSAHFPKADDFSIINMLSLKFR